ncbi:MAG: ABC transporter substrate-binding protein [Deltaproteobacteria bacterium]|nr:ABC transporter substrate-binding protein [Deltaproteobacteria bacterium]
MKRIIALLILVILSTQGIRNAQSGSAKPIRIGSVLPLTGIFSAEGSEMKNAIELAREEINEAGRILGHTLEIIWEDTESNAVGATRAFKKLVYVHAVPIILSGISPSINTLLGQEIQQSKILHITIGPAVPRFREPGPYFFSVMGSAADMGTELANMVIEASNPKTLGFITLDSLLGRTIQKSAKRAFQNKGIKIVAEAWPTIGKTDFSSHLLRLYKQRPEVAILTAFGNQSKLILEQASQAGFALQKSGWYAPYIDLLIKHVTPDVSAGLAGVTLGVVQEKYKNFVNKYKQRFREVPETMFSVYAYDATKILADAIRLAKSTDPDKIKDALLKIKYLGVTGSKSFDQDGMVVSQIYQRLFFKEGKLVKFRPCPMPPWCKYIKYQK